MATSPTRSALCFAAGLLIVVLVSVTPAAADEYPVILRGKVVMQDGSPLPDKVSLERTCSNSTTATPGPLVRDDGSYIWRLRVDPLASRQCYLQAGTSGYISTQFNLSELNGTQSSFEVPDLLLYPESNNDDPRLINTSEQGVPRKARDGFHEAIAALQAGDYNAAIMHLRTAVEAEPKFARGWHILGVLYESRLRVDEARDAYQHAVDADKKMLEPHVTLSQLALKAEDWELAATVADELGKQDKKRVYPEAYLYLAAARFHLNDLDGAEEAANEALNPKEDRHAVRAEYVLGRVLAAKGDLEGARMHIESYLSKDPGAPDANAIRASLDSLGESGGGQPKLVVF